MAKRPKPYKQLSAVIGVDEIFFAAVTGWIIGALAFTTVTLIGAATHYYEPYWVGDGFYFFYFMVGMTTAIAWIVISLEIKIRRRQP